jgi:predicted RNA methylase
LLIEIPLRVVTVPLDRHLHRRLDARLGTDTGIDPVDTWRNRSEPESFATTYLDSVEYEPTPVRQFHKVLRSLPHLAPTRFVFVDIGCGKGRLLLLAARYGFRRVIGIEVDPRLVEIARANIRAFLATSPSPANVEVIDADAANYDFPVEPAVVFMYNPFGAETTRAVIESVERSLKESPRPLFLVYLNPRHRHILDESPLFRRLSLDRRAATYQASVH